MGYVSQERSQDVIATTRDTLLTGGLFNNGGFVQDGLISARGGA
jgi:hypothetical protein